MTKPSIGISPVQTAIIAVLALSTSACIDSSSSSSGISLKQVVITEENARYIAEEINDLHEDMEDWSWEVNEFSGYLPRGVDNKQGAQTTSREYSMELVARAEKYRQLFSDYQSVSRARSGTETLPCEDGGEGRITVTTTADQVTFKIDCRWDYDSGDGYVEREREEETFTISRKAMEGYSQGYAVSFDSKGSWEDTWSAGSSSGSHSGKGSFDYGYNADNDFKLARVNAKGTAKGTWSGGGQSGSWEITGLVDGFEFVASVGNAGEQIAFSGTTGSNGKGDWIEVIGGTVDIRTDGTINVESFRPVGTVHVEGANNTSMVIDYQGDAGVAVTVNGETTTYTWNQFDDWIADW